jgi:hypothetical protein
MGQPERRTAVSTPRESSGGRAPLVFDLTAFESGPADPPVAPSVYYLVGTEPDPSIGPPWVAALGISSVVVVGVGLGLLLAKILL